MAHNREDKRRAARAELVGLLVVVVLILALVMARWGGSVHWSAR